MQPDTTPQLTEQTNPADTGSSTTEYKLARASAIFGAILAGAISLFTSLQESLPAVAWIASALGILGAVAVVIGPLLKYLGGRTAVKVALVQHATAQALLAASPPPTAPKSVPALRP